MLVVEEQQRRHSSLRWGIVLTFIAVGFGLIEAFGWKDATPGAVAVLIGATGVGNLAFYWLARQMESKDGASGENRQK
jgi:hypothetical protein